mgnify:CR=1 FL=1
MIRMERMRTSEGLNEYRKEMNGYETTKAIRNLPDRPDGKEIPIIAMTANAFAEDVQAALNAGMDDHVAKPVDMRILISVITKYIER